MFKVGDRVIVQDKTHHFYSRIGIIKNIGLSEYTDITIYSVALETSHGEAYMTAVLQAFQLKLVDDNQRSESMTKMTKKSSVKVVPDVEPDEYPIHNGGWSHVLINKDDGVAITMFTCEEDAEWFKDNYYYYQYDKESLIIREYKSNEER